MTRKPRYRRLAVLGTTFVLALVFAQVAQATSLIKIREVYPGASNDSYVELQAYAEFPQAGATLPGKSLILFDTAGDPTDSFTFAQGSELACGECTFLIGDTGVQTTFNVTPDLTDAALNLSDAGGAACWNVGDTPVDCVSWGDFSGEAALEAFSGSSAGNPASPDGITPGKAINRNITPNCPTYLEADDDTDDSATDFTEVTPNPLPLGFGDGIPCFTGMPDDTKITQEPVSPTKSSSATFAYVATTATDYQCKLDDFPRFTPCPNDGQSYTDLAEGSHTFQVRGLNASGPDPAPAKYTWTVDQTAPQANLLTHPSGPIPASNASFTFDSNESGSTYQCRLDGAAFAPCKSGIAYDNLPTGSHTFQVIATDVAGNTQTSPTSFTWSADSSAPVTTIDSGPASPSSSSTASFTYHADKVGSFFECRIDGEDFTSCPNSGATFTGLGAGSHTFQVRGSDSDGHVEASPAAYTFVVGAGSSSRPGPVTCKKGWRKTTVGGKTKCVKAKTHRRHRG